MPTNINGNLTIGLIEYGIGPQLYKTGLNVKLHCNIM